MSDSGSSKPPSRGRSSSFTASRTPSTFAKSLRSYPTTARQQQRESGWKPIKTPSQYTPPHEVRRRMRSRSQPPTPKPKTLESSPLEPTVSVTPPLGSRLNPHPMPNAKASIDAIDQFHGEIRSKMTPEVEDAVRACHTIDNQLTMNESGKFVVPQDRQRSAEYDKFYQQLTRKYGQDPVFRSGPQMVSGSLLEKLDPDKEYIWAKSKGVVRMLPRFELMKLESGEYHVGRHTHPEFSGSDDPSKEIEAAGTYKNGQFNFRTGHYNAHHAPLKKKQQLRADVQEQFQFAASKTFPSKSAHFEKNALPYESSHGVDHTVHDEYQFAEAPKKRGRSSTFSKPNTPPNRGRNSGRGRSYSSSVVPPRRPAWKF